MSGEKYFTAKTPSYPRSFLGLLVVGFLVVALPLLGTLLYSAWHSERLTEQSREAVYGAAKAARASRALVSRIGSLERIALQLAVSPDPRLREDFARVQAGVKVIASELSLLPLDEEQRAALRRAVESAQALAEMMGAARAAPDPAAVRDLAGALVDDAYQTLAASYIVADREVERLGASADEVHRRLIMMVLLATALALAAALALTRRLSEIEAQRSRFLRHLSHDLKTPLAALREGAELLNDQVAGPLAPPQRQVVAILRDNSVKLQRLIEELLDYQRALHAAAGLEVGPLGLDALLRQSVQAHQLAAQSKVQRIELDAEALTVWADPTKLRSVIDNLLGNAVKFTPAGGLIRVLSRANGGAATIEVLDSGPGVPAEEREAIFEAFFRGRAGASGRTEGTGLGLAIAREFTEAHGGRIEAVAGARGGHFRVTLPLRPAAPLAQAA